MRGRDSKQIKQSSLTMSASDAPDPVADAAARAKEIAEQATLPYVWKQTIGDVDISVPIPAGTRARDLDIVMQSKKLKVGLKGREPIMEVSLLFQVDIPSFADETLGRAPQVHPSRRKHLVCRGPEVH
jgi:hypothetical protein